MNDLGDPSSAHDSYSESGTFRHFETQAEQLNRERRRISRPVLCPVQRCEGRGISDGPGCQGALGIDTGSQ